MRKHLLSVAVLAAAAPAGAQCTPEWLPIGDLQVNPSTGAVTSVTEWDPDGPGPASPMLIAGGAGLLGTDHLVAAWDGQVWMPLGSGLRDASGGTVRSVLGFEGSLVAVGAWDIPNSFATAARWNGTSWSQMGTGTSVFTSLAIDDAGSLVATGYPTGPLFQWNGAAWQQVGAFHTSQYGYAVVNYNGERVVGGSLSNLAQNQFFSVGHWTGSDWAPYGQTIGGQLYSSFAMVSYQGQLIATDYANSTLVRWNGVSWQSIGNPIGTGGVSSLFVYNGELFAAGKVTGPRGWVSRYTGSGWSTIGETNIQSGPWFPPLGLYNGDLIFGGKFQSINGIPALNIARWHCTPCYANCDRSGAAPVLNINDFVCFMNRFGVGDSYANCDESTTAPVLNVNDFVCFQQRFAAGCN